jgi:2-iminoacetate synthase
MVRLVPMATHLRSGPPWNLACVLGWTEDGLSCRLEAAGARSSSAALATWSQGRARIVRCDPGREGEIARSAAHRLCRSARMAVRCEVSLPEAPEAPEANGVLDEVPRLVERASRAVEERRIRHALGEPTGLHRRISEIAAELEPRVAAFLSRPLETLLAEHAERAGRIHAQGFQRRVQLFAPLYVSNACLNDCAYCGFRRSAVFTRTHLSTERAVNEARRLAEAGHRSIDLVTGEIPTGAFVERIADVVRRIRAETLIRHVNLNLGALSGEQYGELRRAGAEGYHLYQETYDPEAYLRLHRRGPKRDAAHRLEGLHRALRAGFPAAGLGILLGLGEPARDLASLAAHARILEREFPRAQMGFSLPRWRAVDAACAFTPPAPVGDETLAAAFLYLRLEFPRAHLTLTTREPAELRDRLVPLGITKMSAGVSTAPGGYTDPAATEQFAVHDTRALEVVEARIRSLGGLPVRSPARAPAGPGAR